MEDGLLIKYIKHECSLDEARNVLRWIEASEDNKLRFKELQVAWALIEMTISVNKQAARPRKKYILYTVVATVASVAAALLWFIIPERQLPQYDYKTLLGNFDKQKEIILMVNNDKPIVLSDSSAVISYNRQGQILINDSIKIEEEVETVLNTLYVPYGKRTKMILADGTQVYLNSGSTLVYPSSFDGVQREVYLEGEAYFNVKKEESFRRFVVQTAYKSIEVLGTQFNVLAEEGELFEAVLVTGKIALESKSGKVVLEPNQYYGYSPETGKEQIKGVDVSDYVSWINGKLKFSKEPLSKVLHKVEKIYNVKVTLLYPEYDNYKVSGSLDMKNTPEETLNVLMQTLTPYGEKNQLYKLTVR